MLTLQADLRAQEEMAKQASLSRERCEIRAPFHAVVTERLAGVGASAVPGTPLVHLVQLDQVEVSARVRPDTLDEGFGALNLYFSYLKRRYPLQLLRVLPVVDPGSRTVELRLGFTAEPAPPGASGRVHWQSAHPHLPADLLVRREGRLGVFLFNDNLSHLHPLLGALEGQPARSDLPEDARIVVQGRHILRDGTRVEELPGHKEPIGIDRPLKDNGLEPAERTPVDKVFQP